jgi:hypothetical protein
MGNNSDRYKNMEDFKSMARELFENTLLDLEGKIFEIA